MWCHQFARRFGRRIAAMSAVPALVCGLAAAGSPAPAQGRVASATSGDKARIASGRSHRASREISVINARLDHCYDAADSNPTEIQACDSKAINGFDAQLRPSRNKPFRAFLPQLFESIYSHLTNGDDASSLQVVASASNVDLARKRAAILSGADTSPHVRRGHPSLSQLLRRLPDNRTLRDLRGGRSLQELWVRARNEDCATHPVRDCAARLDAALAEMLEGLFDDK